MALSEHFFVVGAEVDPSVEAASNKWYDKVHLPRAHSDRPGGWLLRLQAWIEIYMASCRVALLWHIETPMGRPQP